MTYVGAVTVAAVAAVVALAAAPGPGFDDPLLIALFGALIVGEHLFEARLVRDGEQGESTTHEESFFVAMTLLASPLAVVAAFAAGFLVGNVVRRRAWRKALFNVAAMTLTAAASLLVVVALGGADQTAPRSAFAVLAGGVVFVVVNRAVVSGVLALAGAGAMREHLLDDLPGRAVVAAGDLSIGLLAGLAAAVHLWTLPFSLAAMLALHFALSGHVRGRAERQKFADLVSSSSDGIFSVDRSGTVISWNPASETITGYAASDVLGRPIAEVFSVLAAEREPRAMRGAEPDDDQPDVLQIRTAGGETRWLSVTRAPLPEGGFVFVLRDETARRLVDEMVATQERERLRSDLIATVSHELRTPITSIVGFARTLLAHEPHEAERRRYVEIIRKEGERLSALIDDLLDLRQIAEHRFQIDAERVDLLGMLRDEVEVARDSSPAHNVVLDVPDEPIWVTGDRRRLRQVVDNLVSNAIKYSPDGGDVVVAARRDDGRVRVSVTDSGLGIPSDQHADVFTRFFRADSPRHREIGGTGLGLALAREIVEAHGGAIAFTTAEHEGSTFYFDLPDAAVE